MNVTGLLNRLDLIDIMREQLYFPFCHCLQTHSDLLLLPVGDNFGRYLAFLSCDHFLLILLLLFFSFPYYNLGIGEIFLKMALKAETTHIKNRLVCVKIKYFNISKAS